jgi:hypothetical protein
MMSLLQRSRSPDGVGSASSAAIEVVSFDQTDVSHN